MEKLLLGEAETSSDAISPFGISSPAHLQHVSGVRHPFYVKRILSEDVYVPRGLVGKYPCALRGVQDAPETMSAALWDCSVSPVGFHRRSEQCKLQLITDRFLYALS